MQSKVSMVVPCYNKASYIGVMLDSVIAQIWDNIELILVNDGSSDKTGEVIAEYEPKLRARGYAVVILEQKNAGCCGAVYAGLKKMTGEYLCLVDCDDEIQPEYVTRMAGWLDEYADYDWTVCSYRPYSIREGKKEPMPITSCAAMADEIQLLERHILRKIITTSWVYMTRVSYLKRCRLIENFCIDRKKTYEPLFAVPLMLGGGKLKCFDEPLYKFNRFASDLYSFDSYEKVDKYYTDYSYLYNWGIERASIPRDEKDRLLALVLLGRAKDCLYHLNDMDPVGHTVRNREQFIDDFADQVTTLVDELFDPKPHLKSALFKSNQYSYIMNLLDSMILEPDKQKPPLLTNAFRIIAYGVLGKMAGFFLPVLAGTPLEPVFFWDMDAEADTTVLGQTVTKPNFGLLREDDVILVFPKSPEIHRYVRWNAHGARVINVAAERELILRSRFPEITLNCKFVYYSVFENSFSGDGALNREENDAPSHKI